VNYEAWLAEPLGCVGVEASPITTIPTGRLRFGSGFIGLELYAVREISVEDSESELESFKLLSDSVSESDEEEFSGLGDFPRYSNTPRPRFIST